jgi:hypothetical protein
MASQPAEFDDLEEIRQRLRRAVKHCEDLLDHARLLLGRVEQDNDPPTAH